MSWVDEAVQTFGRDLGFQALRLPVQGAVELSFERRGTLAIERAEEDLLLYLQRSRAHAGPERLAKALRLCHWRQNQAQPVRAGAKDDQVVLLIRLPAREVAPEAMAQAFERLLRLMDELDS